MAQPPDNFSALLDRVRRGDDAAVKELVQRYEGVVRRAARGLLGPAMRPQLDSVDIVQSVHRSLLIGLRKEQFALATPDHLIALALTLVRRKVSRQWRRIKRQQVPPGRTPCDVQRGSPQPGPADAAQYNDAVRHVLAHIDDTQDRKLVELRLQGFSTSEVARQMNLDSRFLRVRLGRLRHRLRERGLLTEWL
jgi:RNA polymerase sigma-70 factor (ECF subfamily)